MQFTQLPPLCCEKGRCWSCRIKAHSRHAGLDAASRTLWIYWIPAFAGMTVNSKSMISASSSTC